MQEAENKAKLDCAESRSWGTMGKSGPPAAYFFPMARERQYREQIVRYGRMLHANGMVAATDGNLSVRLGPNRILVTPTCMSKGAMRASDMVIVDMEGRLLSGRRKVSS